MTDRIVDGKSYPGMPFNPYKMRVRMSGTLTVLNNPGTPPTVPFDTIDFDTMSAFNTTTHQWKVPVAGYYNMLGKANFTPPGGGGSGMKWALMLVRFYQNGNRITEGVQTVAGDFTTTTGFITGAGYDTITVDTAYFAQGDLIDLRVSQTNDAALSMTVAAGLFTYANIHLLSVI